MSTLIWILGSIKSWFDGFNSAALGVAVLVGEYYIFSKGFRYIKNKVEKMASEKGVDCWVVMQRTQRIVFKNPKKVSARQKAKLEAMLFAHILVLMLASVLWLGLVVGLGMLLFHMNR